VLVEPPIGIRDQSLVELHLILSLLCARNQDDCPAKRIERKCGSPFLVTLATLESQLLHVRVLRTFQRVDVRATRLWSGQPYGSRSGEETVLNVSRKILELSLEVIVKFNGPFGRWLVGSGHDNGSIISC